MSLPIIDMSGLWSDNVSKKVKIGEDIRKACLDNGFFYLRGHDVSKEMCKSALEVTRMFFSLPLKEKLKVDKSHSMCNRGYEKLRGQTLEPGAPADLKEGYYIGLDLPEDDIRVVDGKFNHGPNIWPENLPKFREELEQYYEKMLAVARTLMRGLALSLRLDENHFDDFSKEELATLRLLHYPEQPPNSQSGEKGAGAHTDFGTLTLLLQDDCGGLQVWDENKRWIEATPIADTFVVNLGDMIARWTNDSYRSTLHRVINHSGEDRYSIPFFYLGNPDIPIACIHTCLEEGEEPKYPVTTVEAHYRNMYDVTYKDKQ